MFKYSIVLSAFLANATSLKSMSAVKLNTENIGEHPPCPCGEVPSSGNHACQCFTVGCVETVCAQAKCEAAGDQEGDFEGECCDKCFLRNNKLLQIVPPGGIVSLNLDELF